MKEAYIQISKLSKKYKKANHLAIDGLDLSIYEGQIHAILGPNGAGKTTSLNILCGLLNADSGTIKIGAYEMPQQKNKIKHLIGLVPQDIALYEELTAYENLMFFGSMYQISKKLLKTRIETYLKRLGLYESKDKKIASYSGGMKRRINLIAGLLHAPKVLILDEPIVGVDVQSKHVIIDFLKDLNREGTTIIYTSHMLADVEILCEYVSIIDQGKLIEQGEPKILIDKHKTCENLEEIFLYLTGKKLRDS